MLDNDVFTCAYYVLLSSIAGLHWMHACGYDIPKRCVLYLRRLGLPAFRDLCRCIFWLREPRSWPFRVPRGCDVLIFLGAGASTCISPCAGIVIEDVSSAREGSY